MEKPKAVSIISNTKFVVLNGLEGKFDIFSGTGGLDLQMKAIKIWTSIKKPHVLNLQFCKMSHLKKQNQQSERFICCGFSLPDYESCMANIALTFTKDEVHMTVSAKGIFITVYIF